MCFALYTRRVIKANSMLLYLHHFTYSIAFNLKEILLLKCIGGHKIG